MSYIKNIKKYLSITLLFVLFFNTSASYAWVQLKVKLDESISYGTLIELNNNDTLINFEILIPVWTTWNYSISLPNWLEKLWVNSSNTCDITKIINHTDSTFSFSANWQTPFCKYILNYKVWTDAIAWTYPISVLNLWTWTAEQQITIKVSTANALTKAETIDSNSNWFIDKYKLTFSTWWLSGFSNTNLKIWTLTPTLSSVSNDIAYLNITDWIYTSGDKPQITDTDWGVFSNVWIITENSIIEEDKSEPIILEINWTNIVWQSNPSINIFENSKLVIKFSEKIYSNSIISWFKLLENGINITNINNLQFNESDWDTMYYCIWWYDLSWNCNTNFNPSKSYSIELWNNMIDLNSNTYTWWAINVSINVTDITPPISSSITYNSETNNWIIINWNSWNNNYTNSSAWLVNLNIWATDNSLWVNSMCISENNTLTNDNVCDSWWKTYSATTSFNLTWNEWTKTLYIKFKDASWNISLVSNDSIIWDKTPSSSSSSPNGWSFNNWTQNVLLNCIDSISGCSKIYYTTNWTTPSTSSLNVSPWNNISLSWNNETINLKFFSKDLAWNNEWITNSKNFIFSTSYVTFNNTELITNNTNITLTWTCNNALWSSSIEYSLNWWSYTNVTNDNCDSDNTWSSNLNLTSNQNNTIDVRIKNNTSIKSNITITQDNISPNNLNLKINNWNNYTNSNNVTLTISANDINWTDKMCVTENSSLTNDNICTWSSWENYSNSKNISLSSSEWLKTVYIKFRDVAWNISWVINDNITLETTIPTVSANLASWNYTWIKSVSLISSNSVYYTTSWINPTNSSTLYTWPLTFWTTVWTVNLKAIAYWNSWINWSVQTYTYNFWCFPSTLANWTIWAYPNCIKTCNSWYTLNGSSCIKNESTSSSSSSSSGGWSSSWGWWASPIADYENFKYISKTTVPLLEVIVNKIFKKYWILDTSKLSNTQLTWVNWIIELKSALKGLSNMVIWENTSIIWNSKQIYAPYSLELKRDLKLDNLKVDNVAIKTFNIKKLFFVWNLETTTSFDKEIEINFDLWWIVEWKVNVYSSETIDWNFQLVKSWLETKENWTISFKTNKLWYFIIIRDMYLSKYFWNQTVSTGEIIEKENFEEEYIIKTNRDWLEIYKTTYEPIAKLVDALESAMVKKLNKLLSQNRITQETYNQTIKDYNQFILYLTIYRKYKNKDAAYKALIPWRKFLKVYKM